VECFRRTHGAETVGVSLGTGGVSKLLSKESLGRIDTLSREKVMKLPGIGKGISSPIPTGWMEVLAY